MNTRATLSAEQMVSTPSCVVCGAQDWTALPMPGLQSITTAGKIVRDALGKGYCNHCGVVQKVFRPRLGETDFYEREYTYYERPGASSRDQIRYRTLAKWVAEAIAPKKPASIFDVGCGQGSTLNYLREMFPGASVSGIEPSSDAVSIARSHGIDVIEGRLDKAVITGTFDLVFSNNVIQHVLDPVGFLLAQKALLAPGGDLVISCPDGTLPNVELLMADQNISLRPPHLAALAAKAGLRVKKTLPCPGGPLRNEQLAVLMPDDNAPAPAPSGSNDRVALEAYLNQWSRMDEVLVKATDGARHVYNFGGGLWSYVLAAYCPRYWSRVKCCLVDGFDGRCIDKEVSPFENVDVSADDVLVLGTNPYVQPQLVQRFKEAGLRAVAFSHLIED